MTTINNPILSGCYPDPSICRVGQYYYLVCSSFEMWPGLPIFRSTDLARWEQIGHVIDREAQMTFRGTRSSHGLFAPTIRHHEGTFYLVCTRVGSPDQPHEGNFLVTAEDPAGEWSAPLWLTDEQGNAVDGIDPSIFFDQDGRVWLHGTRPCPEPEWEGQTRVWLRELDLSRGVVVGEEHILWTGAVRGAVWAEGPHLFVKDGIYYLLAAEGGTEFHHAVCIARADHVTGPYAGNKTNPVLTHRHLGHPGHGIGPDVVGVGHADLVEAPDGSWWAVLLGVRPYGGYHYNLGRETFLVPVVWQDGWPVFAPGAGRVPTQLTGPGPESRTEPDDADAGSPRTSPHTVLPTDQRWTSLRGPWEQFAQPAEQGWRIQVQSADLQEPGTPSFLGLRQQHQCLDLTARLDLGELAAGEEAGIVVRQSEDFHAFLSYHRLKHGGWQLRTVLTEAAEEQVLLIKEAETASTVDLGIRIREQDYTFTINGEMFVTVDGRKLDTVTTGGFLGLWLGVFATSRGEPTSSEVLLSSLEYAPATARSPE